MSYTWRDMTPAPGLSFRRVCTAESMWDTHSYARASCRRLIIDFLDNFGAGTATYHVLPRVISA